MTCQGRANDQASLGTGAWVLAISSESVSRVSPFYFVKFIHLSSFFEVLVLIMLSTEHFSAVISGHFVMICLSCLLFFSF